jgi:DNA-binding CsgD family transcriptional regulator
MATALPPTAGDAGGRDLASVDGLCARAQVALRRGRLGLAFESAAEAVRLADAGGSEARLRHPRLLLALTALAMDRLEEAERALVTARQEAAEYGSAWTLPHTSALQVALLVARGDPRVAGIDAEPFALLLGWGLVPAASAGDEGPLPPLLLALHPPAVPRAVRIAIRGGEPELAISAARQVSEVARRNRGVASLVGCSMHALGLVEKSVERLHAATTVLRTGPRPLALAAALEDLARALDGSGDRDGAVAAHREALDLYARAGARPDAARVRGELRALGAHGRYRVAPDGDGSGWDSLTRTELEVAALVAEGLSNRQVAERLFVSGSTIDTHVRHIYGKLGLNSRVELARLVAARTAG